MWGQSFFFTRGGEFFALGRAAALTLSALYGDPISLHYLGESYYTLYSPFIKDEFGADGQRRKEIGKQIRRKVLSMHEVLFFMAQGYAAYEQPLPEPINYRSDTSYQGQIYPDCGETSLRNILSLILSFGKGGMITKDAIDTLRQKLPPMTPDSPFEKMVALFLTTPLSHGAQRAVHQEWAKIVSHLNGNQELRSLNDIQYGRRLGKGPQVYEIKANIHLQVKGIVNMLNVIGKLFPDSRLNAPWDPDQESRLKQVAEKLDRFCELLSREGVTVSWEKEDNQEITDEFPHIIFAINGTPALRWRFLQAILKSILYQVSRQIGGFIIKSVRMNG